MRAHNRNGYRRTFRVIFRVFLENRTVEGVDFFYEPPEKTYRPEINIYIHMCNVQCTRRPVVYTNIIR